MHLTFVIKQTMRLEYDQTSYEMQNVRVDRKVFLVWIIGCGRAAFSRGNWIETLNVELGSLVS